MTTVLSVRVDDATLAEFDEAAKAKGVSRTALLRGLVDAVLEPAVEPAVRNSRVTQPVTRVTPESLPAIINALESLLGQVAKLDRAKFSLGDRRRFCAVAAKLDGFGKQIRA